MTRDEYGLVESAERNAELVFGLVAPIGTDAYGIADNLVSQLKDFGTEGEVVRLSDLIQPLSDMMGLRCDLRDHDPYERITSRIEAANKLYQKFNERADDEHRNSLLAIAAAESIFSKREDAHDRALLNRASILVTLKRPEEVQKLRRIYGTGLHVIGVFATEEERIRQLHRKQHIKEELATTLVKQDKNDQVPGGQRTGDAFQLADLFLDFSADSDDWRKQLGRYLDLLFSHPYKTPTRDEQAMFFAYSASLRSAQFGRQVGASLATEEGDVISVGCNEVPKGGGGQYWEKDSPDERDHALGRDSNDFRKNEILQEIMSVLPPALSNNKEIEDKIRGTSLFSITEFGRAVHAEMEAILSCARKGISPVGKVLYTTVFPCHNCARHIVAAGIKRVVFIEAYSKSKAKELYDDTILLEEAARRSGDGKAVAFVPFVGISPRKYADMFTTRPVYGQEIDRKTSSGHVIDWQRGNNPLRTKMASISYIDRELRAVSRLNEILRELQTKTDGAQEAQNASENSQSGLCRDAQKEP